ncbi:dual specificity protein phosphatase family protein [Candidatus Uhrbacteria bacterium]|nr:dual specificity protein phosphatase family protein [Candidatus Uhrbacteria bacterium]
MTKNEHAEGFEFSYITESIIIGTNQCCQSHFSEKLLSLGITVDLSLEEKRVDAPVGVESYLWLPVTDHTPPTDDQMQIGVTYIGSVLSLGKKIYVHCKNGHGRAPTLVAAYFVSTGKSVHESLSLIKEKRSAIHMEKSQTRALQRFFEKTYTHQKTN